MDPWVPLPHHPESLMSNASVAGEGRGFWFLIPENQDGSEGIAQGPGFQRGDGRTPRQREVKFFFRLLVATSPRDSSGQNEVCKRDRRISESGRH